VWRYDPVLDHRYISGLRARIGRQASLSRWRNREEGRFFPGFFTALYRRRSP
jgi:hypothetical protein